MGGNRSAEIGRDKKQPEGPCQREKEKGGASQFQYANEQQFIAAEAHGRHLHFHIGDMRKFCDCAPQKQDSCQRYHDVAYCCLLHLPPLLLFSFLAIRPGTGARCDTRKSGAAALHHARWAVHRLVQRRIEEKKLIRLPSGSRNSMERLPQGWSVGSRTNFCTSSARRARS